MSESADEISSVVPHELVALQPSDLCVVIWQYYVRLVAHWATKEIDAIKQQHNRVYAAYAQEQPLWEGLKVSDKSTPFNKAYKISKDCLEGLCPISRALTNVSSRSSQEEAIFKNGNGEKNIFKHFLTDLSLEGFFISS